MSPKTFFILASFLIVTTNAITDCGRIKVPKPSGLIVGDAFDSYSGQWPWHVPLIHNHLNYICGATLISPRHLLTAAHCISGAHYTFSPSSLHVLPGRFSLNISESHSLKRTITKTIIHDDFDPKASSFRSNADIAILEMDEPVAFTDFIQPACLPTRFALTYDVTGTVVGHGKHEQETNYEVTPKHANLHTIGFAKCIFTHRDYATVVSERSFCGKSPLSAPCRGDSGGGFFVRDNDTQQFEIFGVVSQARDAENCNPQDYTIFVEVPRFVEWIEEKISLKSAPNDPCLLSPPCGPNADCINHNGFGFCTCLSGFHGRPPNCHRLECEISSQCELSQTCSNNRCIDPCTSNPCGAHATCEANTSHGFSCKCPSGYESDHQNGCRVTITDPCQASPCGANAKCINNRGFASCSCEENFIGNPPNCQRAECNFDTDCSSDKACVFKKCTDLCKIQLCGPGVVCEMRDHRRVCKCKAGEIYNANGECEENPNLIDGDVKTYECCDWRTGDRIIDRDLSTFHASPSTVVFSNEAEVAPRFHSTDIESFYLINWCSGDGFGCLTRESVRALPVRLAEAFPNVMAYFTHSFNIRRIRKENFEGLRKLEWLKVINSSLDRIDDDSFEELTGLRFVDLSTNKLTTISTNLFKQNLKLERINLYMNQLSTVTPQHFNHLSGLMHLSLCNNKFTSLAVDFVSDLRKMKIFHLCSNELEKITPKLFENKPLLTYVDLSYNKCVNKEYGAEFAKNTLTDEEKAKLISDVEKCD